MSLNPDLNGNIREKDLKGNVYKMLDQEKLTRDEILRQLDISNDTLYSYERELELVTDLSAPGLDNFTNEDLQSIKFFHKLRESGLTYNEIKLLISFAGVVKNVDFEDTSEIKNILSLSPTYRVKQSLNLARQELDKLRRKAQELEHALKKVSESKSQATQEEIMRLQAELEAKEKAFSNLDRKLSETLFQKAQLESELAVYKEGKNLQTSLPKGKKTRELYQMISQKEQELLESKKKAEELEAKLQSTDSETDELRERLELMEEDIAEMEHEVEERYHEQIKGLREQVETIVDKKQKEWESYYIQTSENHKNEILTLQRKHEQDILRLKNKIKEQIEQIQELQTFRNPLLGLFKMGAGPR